MKTLITFGTVILLALLYCVTENWKLNAIEMKSKVQYHLSYYCNMFIMITFVELISGIIGSSSLKADLIFKALFGPHVTFSMIFGLVSILIIPAVIQFLLVKVPFKDDDKNNNKQPDNKD